MEEIYGDYDYEIPNEEILSTQEKKTSRYNRNKKSLPSYCS